jgi:hypothetical protein
MVRVVVVGSVTVVVGVVTAVVVPTVTVNEAIAESPSGTSV